MSGRIKKWMTIIGDKALYITLSITLVSFSMFVYRIGNPEDFAGSSHINVYLIVFGITFALASFISMFDFTQALLEKGHYKDKDWHIAQKALKLISKYCFLIFSVLMLTTLNELIADFQDKTMEMSHYIQEYRHFEEDPSKEIQSYEHNYYFANKKNRFWKSDTMYVDGEFTDEFLVVQELVKNKEPLDFTNFIEVDLERIVPIINEDIYYTVQILTTLGSGDIVPNHPIGMLIAWVSVLAGQFITIIGVILIVRDK